MKRVAASALLAVISAAAIGSHAASAASAHGALIAQRLPRLEYRGGPFVRRPRVVTITFAGDESALVGRLEAFGSTVTRTPWWRAVIEGYCASDRDCVGQGQPGLFVRLTDALPVDVHAVDVSAILRRHASAGRFGPLDSDALLLVYLPGGVQLRDAIVPRYCRDGPRAFHRALRVNGQTIAYAVMPRCGDEAALTGTASHELLEMAMSPDPSDRGFAFVETALTRGFTAAGNEAMDPCGFITDEPNVLESGFVVRRAWSNLAASQGRNPCVPADREIPFAALVPRQPAVRLPNDGDSVLIELDAAADRPVGDWTVSAVDLTGSQLRTRYVDVALDRTVVTAGETAILRITRHRAHPRGLSVVGLVSTVDGHSYLWPVAVVTS